MKTFFKILLLIVLAANMLLLFVFDRLIPADIQLSFDFGRAETTVTEEPDTEIQEADTEKEPVIPEETSEEQTAEKEPDAEAEPEEPEEEALPVCRIISESGSNVRSGPGSGYEVIGIYPYDTVLTIIGEAEIGWYPIRTEDGAEGYIFESQIVIPDEAAAETGGQAADQIQ